ncbi:hypothetical protein Tco_0475118 [Tanacetum coccineum]
MLRIEILHDVVGTSGYHYGVLRSFPVERIEQGIRLIPPSVVALSHCDDYAYNPKEYDGKGGDIVYTRWTEKMESVQDMSGCRDSQKVKYTAGSFVGKALTWWNSQIHTRGREAAIGMSWENFKTLTREEFCPSNEMQKLVPHLVTSENKRIERYIYVLAPQIQGMVVATEP